MAHDRSDQIDVLNPATGEVIARIAAGGPVEAGAAVEQAQAAQARWERTSAADRSAALKAGARTLRTHLDEPTVLTGVTDGMAVMTEETFGPVAPVRVVSSCEEALELANASEYGLAATVLTRSQLHAQHAWRELRAGTVKINAVFGGAPGGAASPHKASGLGFGYGPELLDEVSQVRVVHMGVLD